MEIIDEVFNAQEKSFEKGIIPKEILMGKHQMREMYHFYLSNKLWNPTIKVNSFKEFRKLKVIAIVGLKVIQVKERDYLKAV